MKQDRNGVRTAQDLERKYDFGSISVIKRNYEIQKQGLTKVENEMNNFITSVTKNIEELQDQVDGNITTWFSNGVPTVDTYPENEWVTIEDKNNHLGDLYYDKDTGYAYRFTLENEEYSWIKISDIDITKALAIANSAQDTADAKRRVFVIRPSPPYDVGDLWIKDEELYRCQTTKLEGENFEDNDWINAVKYTDDTYAIQVNNNLTVLSGTVTEIKEGVDEMSKTITHTNELVDEQGNVIGTLSKETSDMRQSLNEFSQKIEGYIDLERVVEESHFVYLPNASKGPLLKLSISNMRYVNFSNKNFPAFNPKNNILIVDKTRELSGDAKIYKMPYRNLYYYSPEIYDELVIERIIPEEITEDVPIKHSVSVIHRCRITENLEIVPLSEPIKETFEDIEVELFEGDNYIYFNSFQKEDVKYVATYGIKGGLDDRYALKIELSASITVAKQEINMSVDRKIDEETTGGKIILKINGDESDATIQADKVNIEGVITAINNNTTTTIDGDKITTGTITAKEVSSDIITTTNFNAQKINADNITTGTLNGQNVKITNLDAGNITTGTLNGKNVSITNLSASNITSGTLNGSSVSVTNLNASNIKTGTINGIPMSNGSTYSVTSGGVLKSTAGSIGGWTINSNKLGGDNTYLGAGGDCSFYPSGGAIIGWNSQFRCKAPGGIAIYNTYTAYGASTSIPKGIHIMSDQGDLNLMTYDSSHGLNIRSYCSPSSISNAGQRSIRLAAGQNIAMYAVGGYCYAEGNGVSSAKIKTDTGSASSKNVKENFVEFTSEDYDASLDLLEKMKLYNYDYKFDLYKDRSQYGFIIDEIEEIDNKFFKISEDEAIVKGEHLDFNLDNKSDDDTTIMVKKYDSDALDKYLLTVTKALLNKIDKLENRIKEMEVKLNEKNSV